MHLDIQDILSRTLTLCIREHTFDDNKSLKENLLSYFETNPFFLNENNSREAQAKSIREHFKKELPSIDRALMLDPANVDLSIEELYLKSARILATNFVKTHYKAVIACLFDNFTEFNESKFNNYSNYSTAVANQLHQITTDRIFSMANYKISH